LYILLYHILIDFSRTYGKNSLPERVLPNRTWTEKPHFYLIFHFGLSEIADKNQFFTNVFL